MVRRPPKDSCNTAYAAPSPTGRTPGTLPGRRGAPFRVRYRERNVFEWRKIREANEQIYAHYASQDRIQGYDFMLLNWGLNPSCEKLSGDEIAEIDEAEGYIHRNFDVDASEKRAPKEWLEMCADLGIAINRRWASEILRTPADNLGDVCQQLDGRRVLWRQRYSEAAEVIQLERDDGEFVALIKIRDALVATCGMTAEQARDLLDGQVKRARAPTVYVVVGGFFARAGSEISSDKLHIRVNDVLPLLGLRLPEDLKLVRDDPSKLWIDPAEYRELWKGAKRAIDEISEREGWSVEAAPEAPDSPDATAAPSKPTGDEPSAKGRNTALCIIAALARLESLDISQPYKAADIIEGELSRMGVTLGKDAIAKWLKEVPRAIQERKR